MLKNSLLVILEIFLLIAGLVLYALGYLPFPILPLFLLAWVSLRLRHLRWRDVGLRRPSSWLRTIGLAVLIGAAYQVLDILLIAPLLQKVSGEAVNLSQFAGIQGNIALLVVSLVISWTLAAFIEEMFFRGYLLNRMLDFAGRRKLGFIIALLGNALIFSLAHFYQGITGVVDTFLAGLLLSGLYFYAGENLWLPILTHGVIDTLAFLLIYFGLS
jgi:membrane protease YdiL (CAAX protease family)